MIAKQGATPSSMGDASAADLERGFQKLGSAAQAFPIWGRYSGEDSDGSTYVGNPRAKGGFLTRPMGEER